MEFRNGAELLELCAREDCLISQVMRRRECEQGEAAPDRVEARMARALRSMGGLIGGEAKRLATHAAKKKALCGPVLQRAITYAMAVLDVNASMGLIVAAPTAGSSGVVPGLLLALPLLPGHSTLTLTSPPQSAPYIALTEQVLRQGGIKLHRGENASAIPGGQGYALPSPQVVEGDWSAAAPFLCAGALSPAGVTVTGLTLPSLQGDSVLPALLEKMGAEVETSPQSVTVRAGTLRAITVDAGPIPDLIPPLCALCAVARGESRIRNARRLRDKESDRLQGVAELLNGLGGKLTVDGDDLRIFGVLRLQGGTADPRRDHRLAMTAAVAASACTGPVTVLDSDCVQKSYPAFWTDYGQMAISR